MKKNPALILCLALLSICSCTRDDRYNLSDLELDFDVKLFGKGISIPLGYTKNMSLRQFADSLNSEMLCTDSNGDYYLSMSGDFSYEGISELGDFSALNSLSGTGSTVSIPIGKRNAARHGTSDGDTDEISLPFSRKFEVEFLNSSDFPAITRRIDRISLKGTGIYLYFSVENLPESTENIPVEATLTLPEYFDPQTVAVQDVISSGKPLRIARDLNFIKDIELIPGQTIKGEVSFEGTLYIPVNEGITGFQNPMSGELRFGVGDKEGPEDYGRIHINEIVTEVDFEAKQHFCISLEDISSFIGTDNSLRISPVVDLTATTNLGMPITGSVLLVPYVEGKPLSEASVVVDNLELPHSSDPVQTASRSYSFGEEEYDFSRLFRTFPDSICADVSASVLPGCTCIFRPDVEYTLAAEYGVRLPLSFSEGTGFSITEEFETGDFTSEIPVDGTLALNATIASTIPIGVELYATFLDGQGNPIAEAGTIGLRIEPSDGKNESISDISASFKVSESLKEAHPNFISLEINVLPTPDVALNESQYIRIDSISLSSPEGISLNIEKFQKP